MGDKIYLGKLMLQAYGGTSVFVVNKKLKDVNPELVVGDIYEVEIKPVSKEEVLEQ